MLKLIAIAIASIALSLSQSAMCEETKTEKTTDKQKSWIVARIKEHVKVIALRNGKAHFETDGFFLSGNPQMEKTFDKGKGEEFCGQPDHHSSLTLCVKDISKEKGVTITYVSRFNHSSFGKALITEDEGELTLSWR